MESGFQRAHVNVDRIRTLAADYDLDLVVHLPYRIDVASPHKYARNGAQREMVAAMETAAAMGSKKEFFTLARLLSPVRGTLSGYVIWCLNQLTS